MHQMTPRPDSNKNTRAQTIIIIAISLFALTGLLSGFAVGAANRPTKTVVPTPTPVQTQIVSPKITPTPTPDIKPRKLGYPVVTQYDPSHSADGSTPYTLSAHPVDQSIDKGHGKPVNAPNITCRLWLTKESPITEKTLTVDRLKNVASLSEPLPKEEANALVFTEGEQTQNCKEKGDTTWKYQVASSVDAGIYYLVVMTNWEGQNYNWSTLQVTIKEAE